MRRTTKVVTETLKRRGEAERPTLSEVMVTGDRFRSTVTSKSVNRLRRSEDRFIDLNVLSVGPWDVGGGFKLPPVIRFEGGKAGGWDRNDERRPHTSQKTSVPC